MLLNLFFLTQVALAAGPTPFPVFLKQGFSSILEFEEAPTQVVLGDPNGFQVEKLEKSIVLKPLVNYATTNMFVYFKTKPARLFILSASEDAEPTYFKRFETLIPPVIKPSEKIASEPRSTVRQARLKRAVFDAKKDYLTVDIELSADSAEKLVPAWDLIRLKHGSKSLSPMKLWSARREVQKNTRVAARVIFAKPNVPANLADVSLVIPVLGSNRPFSLELRSTR